MKQKTFLIVLLVFFTVNIIWSQVPPTMSYQGVLTDGVENFVPDGNYILNFKIYDVPSGGMAIWTETQNVDVKTGVFNVILGTVNPLHLTFEMPGWLGVAIGSDPELNPRIQLTSSPYSFNSRMIAGGSNRFQSDGDVGIGIAVPEKKLHVIGHARFDLGTGLIDISTPGGWPGFIMTTAQGHRRDIIIDDPDPGSGYQGGMRLLVSDSNTPGSAQNGITITENGEVGIGTSFPDAKLTVEGMIHAKSGGFKFPDGTVQSSAGGGSGSSAAWTRNNSNNFVELTNIADKVGIGTNNPQQKLHVAGIARFDVRTDASIALSTPGGWPGIVALTPGNHRRDIIYDDPDPGSGYKGGIRLLVSNSNAQGGAQNGITITEDGGVGIGTSFPSSKLHINGDVQIGPDSKHIKIFTFGTGEDITSTNTLHLNYDNNQTVAIGAGGTSNFTVSGSIGLGTISPGGKLDIDFGSAGSLVAGTPLGNGPGWIFTSPNGHRRDIVGDNKGLYIGASSNSGASAAHFQISESGNVGIGLVTGVPGNILTIKQNSTTDPVADAWTTYSSRRWKTNIKTIEAPLEIVQKLRGVTYNWKKDGKADIGLIAEEVGEVLPEIVEYEKNGVDAKSLDYSRIVSVLIESVKEQQKQIDKQQEMINKLSEKITTLEKENHVTMR